MKVNVKDRAELARQYFNSGYNCCQSVCLAYADVYGMDKTLMASVATSFGGGFGRLREVCGSVSGMALLAGLQIPHTDMSQKEKKTKNYTLVQHLAGKFKERNGSYICRELLKLPKGVVDQPEPSDRTPLYYQRRPCAEYVAIAAEIYGEMLNECDSKQE